MFLKKVVLKILQNSQENTFARISFLLVLQADAWNFIEKGALAHVFSFEFCKIFKNIFFHRTPLVVASDYFLLKSHRSSRPEVLCERGVLENFAKFTGKHLCQSLFFNKVRGLVPSGVISNNRFPFSNFVFIICQQSRLQKQNISYIFFTCNNFL